MNSRPVSATANRFLGVAILTLTLVWSWSARAQVTASMSVDRSQLSLGEAFTLQISVESSGIHSPDIELPSLDAFEVLQRQVSRPMQFSFSFGSRSERVVRSSTIYTFVLRPQMKGRITIQPVRVKLGDKLYQSRPLTVMVGAGSTAPSPGQPGDPGAIPGEPAEPEQAPNPPAGVLDGANFDSQAFIRTIADKKEAVVGEQVTVSVYLYLRGALSSLPPVEAEPSTDGFWVRDLLPPSRTLDASRQVVGNTLYKVYLLRRFAAFPLRAGTLSIGPMKVRIEQNAMPDIFDLFDMMDRGAAPTLKRSGVPVAITVRELPAAGKPGGEVAVGKFEISAKLDREEVRTGDAVMLKAQVRGQGNIQTVNIPTPRVDGLQILTPQVSDAVEAPDNVVTGNRSYEWLVVPQQPGRFTIGPIGIDTFDPSTGRYQRVQSQPLPLIAAGKGEDKSDKIAPAMDAPSEKPADPTALFGPIRSASALARQQSRLLDTPWYFLLLVLGPVSYLLTLGVSAGKRVLQARAQKSGPQRAAKQAKECLQQAAVHAKTGESRSCYAQLSNAITGLLEARLGTPVSGHTRPELRAYLTSRGMPEPLVAETIEGLERSEAARFSAATADRTSMKADLDRVKELLKRLSSFTPKEVRS
jgi:hypothetical protein